MAKISSSIFIFICTCTFGQYDFSRIPASTDSTYGYSDTNPLKMKKGSIERSLGYSYDFLKGLRTSDNQKLIFVQRSSIDNPGKRRKVKVMDSSSRMSVNRKDHELDKYIFVTSEKKDTLTIYVDLYNKGDLNIPVGLKYK